MTRRSTIIVPLITNLKAIFFSFNMLKHDRVTGINDNPAIGIWTERIYIIAFFRLL